MNRRRSFRPGINNEDFMEKINLKQCIIKYGFDYMDFLKVTEMLSKAFWSTGIKIGEVKKGALNSALVAGVFYNYEQVAYARVVSDKPGLPISLMFMSMKITGETALAS
jgi:hypothetical protein